MMSQNKQVYPVIWSENAVWLIDQTRLPNEYPLVEIHRSNDMAQAVKTMIVRGAPAIGVAAGCCARNLFAINGSNKHTMPRITAKCG